jgi:hypothetical protein
LGKDQIEIDVVEAGGAGVAIKTFSRGRVVDPTEDFQVVIIERLDADR